MLLRSRVLTKLLVFGKIERKFRSGFFVGPVGPERIHGRLCCSTSMSSKNRTFLNQCRSKNRRMVCHKFAMGNNNPNVQDTFKSTRNILIDSETIWVGYGEVALMRCLYETPIATAWIHTG